MTKISRSEYENIPNKFQQGQPSQYFVQRNLSNVEINLYQTPNETDTQINYFYVGRIEDVGAYTNEPDAPFRFLPCISRVSLLSWTRDSTRKITRIRKKI